MRDIVTWVVVADGARARILRQDSPRAPLVEEPVMHAASSAPAQAYVSDRPGRAFESASATRHAIEPRVDWHVFEKQLFARDMAALLDRNADHYDRLILVAPPKTLGELRAAMGPAAAKVAGELGKELTHLTVHELKPHLQPLLDRHET